MAIEIDAWLGPYDRFQLDQYLPADYKGVLSTRYRRGVGWMAPDWMGEHRRRIQYYTSLIAYRDNAARALVAAMNETEREERDSRREYGDGNLLVEQIRSACIGDRQSIAVAGADKYDPDAPTPEAQAAFDQQERLTQWAEDERFITKMIETERNAVSTGDGIYSLGWSTSRNRVALRTWDPATYFPVLDDSDESEYPKRVHLAWQLEDEDGRNSRIRVRRLTYDLRTVEPYDVPWSDDNATESCFFTDATYLIDRDSRSPDDLTLANAEVTQDEEGDILDRDLGIDFIPVIHIPNTVSVAAHYGRSALSSVLQLLDDIHAVDSDLQAASAMTGSPMLALSGDAVDAKIAIGPNKALNLGPNGSATVISGADGLASLQSLRDGLRKLLSENSRVPASVLGRTNASDYSSGIHLQLDFGPMKSLVEEMRLVRTDKYRLLNKFVQRFNMRQDLAEGRPVMPVLDADLVFGAYLPSDESSVVTMVTNLLTAKAISLPTALKMLQEVGVPIEDVGEEMTEIDKRNYEGAVALLDASGNPDAVGEMLGVKVEGPPQPEPVPPQLQQQPVVPAPPTQDDTQS